MVLKKEVSRTFFDEQFLGFPKAGGFSSLLVLFSSLISAIVSMDAVLPCVGFAGWRWAA
jgi:hypothetical protein